jgi:DNA-binding CsgD family transcriptional regulator
MDINNLDNEKEKQVLALWACSQTVKESAKHLGISVRSVNYYRGRLKCRLGVNSSNEFISQIIFMKDFESLLRLGKEYLLESYQQ